MPNLVNQDVLLYTINYEIDDQRFQNTAYYKYTDSFAGADDYATLCNAFLTGKEIASGFLDDLKDMMTSRITIRDHRMQKVSPTRWAPIVHTLNDVGTKVTQALPGNVAMVCTRRTIMGTRWGIGSWHQPGLCVDQLFDSSSWNALTVDGLAQLLNEHIRGTFLPGGSFGNIKNVLWSPNEPLRFTEVTSYTSQYTPRVMRRRTVGVGI